MALAVALVMGLPHRPDLPLMGEEYTRIQVGESPGQPFARAQGRFPSTQRKEGFVQPKRTTVCGRREPQIAA